MDFINAADSLVNIGSVPPVSPMTVIGAASATGLIILGIVELVRNKFRNKE